MPTKRDKRRKAFAVQSASHRDRGLNTDMLHLAKLNHYVHVNVVSKSYVLAQSLLLAAQEVHRSPNPKFLTWMRMRLITLPAVLQQTSHGACDKGELPCCKR